MSVLAYYVPCLRFFFFDLMHLFLFFILILFVFPKQEALNGVYYIRVSMVFHCICCCNLVVLSSSPWKIKFS